MLSEHFRGDFSMRAITATTFASAVLLALMSGAVLAQTTGTVNPSATPAESSGKEDVPPGGCMPIGMTASGEMVFPIQCRGIIERERGKAVEQNPSAVEQKPAARQSEAVAPESSNPAIKPVETVPVPKRVEHAEPKPLKRAVRRGGCQNFQSYDPESGTYTGYDGQRHSCR
jgi:BA14K-like protein